jgi:sugar lactone lactonase YvrE
MCPRVRVSQHFVRRSAASMIAASLLLWVVVHAASITPVVTFAPPNFPESIAIDKKGNTYVSMLATGAIRKIAPDGTQSTLAVLGSGPTMPFPGRRLTGLAVDARGNVYAALNDVAGTRGIWRISGTGTAALVAALPFAQMLNGLAFDARGNLYVSDSLAGIVYRVERDGSVTDWSTDPLLLGFNPTACGSFPAGPGGANGMSFDKHGDLFVANTTIGAVVRIPVAKDGSAEVANYFAGPTCDLWGADGTAFDKEDNLYVAVNIQGKIVRIDPYGNMDTLAAAPADTLYAPAAIAFGTRRGTRKQIFIANFAVPPLGGGIPGVVTMNVGVRGRPLPWNKWWHAEVRNHRTDLQR